MSISFVAGGNKYDGWDAGQNPVLEPGMGFEPVFHKYWLDSSVGVQSVQWTRVHITFQPSQSQSQFQFITEQICSPTAI